MTAPMEFLIGHIVELIEDMPCPNGYPAMAAGSRGILCEYDSEHALWVVFFDGEGSKRYVTASKMRLAGAEIPSIPTQHFVVPEISALLRELAQAIDPWNDAVEALVKKAEDTADLIDETLTAPPRP